jgi:hypothetical protein
MPFARILVVSWPVRAKGLCGSHIGVADPLLRFPRSGAKLKLARIGSETGFCAARSLSAGQQFVVAFRRLNTIFGNAHGVNSR